MIPTIHYFRSQCEALRIIAVLARVSGTGGKKAFSVSLSESYTGKGKTYGILYHPIVGRSEDGALLQYTSWELLQGYVQGYLAASKKK